MKQLAEAASVKCSEATTHRTLADLGVKRRKKPGGLPRLPKESIQVPNRLVRVVSGGQTGVDQAALRAASAASLLAAG